MTIAVDEPLQDLGPRYTPSRSHLISFLHRSNSKNNIHNHINDCATNQKMNHYQQADRPHALDNGLSLIMSVSWSKIRSWWGCLVIRI